MVTIKAGTTYILLFSCDIDEDLIDSAIITFDGMHKKVAKTYPTEVSLSNGHFSIPLYQQDTIALYSMEKPVSVEAQINLKDKSVIKSDIVKIYVEKTVATEVIDGNTPSATTQEIEFSFEGQVIVAKVSGEITPKQIADAIEEYFKEHPLDIPSKTSDLVNDSDFTTMANVEAKGYQTASEVDSAITSKGYTTLSAVEGLGYQTETQVNSLINSAITEAINGEY